MHTLITNDDGIRAPGIKALAQHFRSFGPVTVVAPSEQRSAASHSLTFHEPLRILFSNSEPGYVEYAVTGTPADCVMMALFNLMPEPPDIIVSGINRGANVGYDVSYSATIGATLEGIIQGVRSLAVSLVGRDPVHYDTAAIYAGRIANLIVGNGDTKALEIPKDCLLSLNVPDLALDEIKGLACTAQGKSLYKQCVEKRFDPWGQPYYWLSGEIPQGVPQKGSDFEAINNGYVSLTPIHLDQTDYSTMRMLQQRLQ